MSPLIQRPFRKVLRKVVVDFVADVVCPWCCIGLRRLLFAQHLLSDKISVQIRPRPYILRRNLPTEGGVDKMSMFVESFGMTKEQAGEKMDHIRETSKEDEKVYRSMGTTIATLPVLPDMDFRNQRAGNSEEAQRLIHAVYEIQGDHTDDTDKGPDDRISPWLRLMSTLHRIYNCEGKWIGDLETLKLAASRAGIDQEFVKRILVKREDNLSKLRIGSNVSSSKEEYSKEDLQGSSLKEDFFESALSESLLLMERYGGGGVPLFVFDNDLNTQTIPTNNTIGREIISMTPPIFLHGANSIDDLKSAIERASRRPARLCQHYVDLANAHDIENLATYLHPNVDMFGGPCDKQGLFDFFAGYPGIHWEVYNPDWNRNASRPTLYRVNDPAAPGERTVTFSYRRSWDDIDHIVETKTTGDEEEGKDTPTTTEERRRWVVDAEEAIVFDEDGKVVKIFYTKPPGEKRLLLKRPPEEELRVKDGSEVGEKGGTNGEL